jgi:hypothetical protein
MFKTSSKVLTRTSPLVCVYVCVCLGGWFGLGGDCECIDVLFDTELISYRHLPVSRVYRALVLWVAPRAEGAVDMREWLHVFHAEVWMSGRRLETYILQRSSMLTFEECPYVARATFLPQTTAVS